MALTLYERAGHEGRRPSPFSWRARFALAHKGLEPTYVAVRFDEVETIRRLSGQGMVPVLVDGDHVVSDSWRIASHLERAYPDRPSLFGGPVGESLARFVNLWCDEALHPAIRRLVLPDFLDCLDEGGRPYFRKTREEALGARLEDLPNEWPRWQAAFDAALLPVRRLLGERAYLSGEAPAYADYILFGTVQWFRLGIPRDLLAPEDALMPWCRRMAALFGGMADAFPRHPARR
ncbi:MAG: glutathione S-transferase N-terminal domain-containing protein [Alphaproteobacteria bacterium]